MPRNQKINACPPLTIIQANVNKSALAHSLLLEHAYTQQADLILVQEPWIMPDRCRRITKWHPAYSTHAPIADWTLRPRIMTYSLKSRSKLLVEPRGPAPAHPDIALLTINIDKTFSLQIANVYSAPTGCIRAGEGVFELQNALNTTQPALILGDLNIRHEHWDLSLRTPPTAQAKQWQEWCTKHRILLLNQPGVPTHQSGSTIDLVWATAPLLELRSATTLVDHSLDTLSDYYTLWTSLPGGTSARYGNPGQYKMDTLDAELFSRILTDLAHNPTETLALAKLSTPQSQERQKHLDQAILEITEALQIGLRAAARRSAGQACGYRW